MINTSVNNTLPFRSSFMIVVIFIQYYYTNFPVSR